MTLIKAMVTTPSDVSSWIPALNNIMDVCLNIMGQYEYVDTTIYT